MKWFPKPKPHTNPWWIMTLMFGILPLKVTKGNCTQLASCSQWRWSKLHCLLTEVLVCSLGHILTWNSSPNTKWQVQGTWQNVFTETSTPQDHLQEKMVIHGTWNQLHRLFDRQVTGDFHGQVTDDSLWNKLWDSSRACDVCTWQKFPT